MHFSLFALFFALSAANLNVLEWCKTQCKTLPVQNKGKAAILPVIIPKNEYVSLDRSKSSLFIHCHKVFEPFDGIRKWFNSEEAKNALFMVSLNRDLVPGSEEQWEFVSKKLYQKLIDELRSQKEQFIESESEKIEFEDNWYHVTKAHIDSFINVPSHYPWSFNFALKLNCKGYFQTTQDTNQKFNEYVAFAVERAKSLYPDKKINQHSATSYPDNELNNLQVALCSKVIQEEFISEMQNSKLVEQNFIDIEISLVRWNQKIVSLLNLFDGLLFYPQFNHLPNESLEFSHMELTKEFALEVHEIDHQWLIEQLNQLVYSKEHSNAAMKSIDILQTVNSHFKSIHQQKVETLAKKQQLEIEETIKKEKEASNFRIKVIVVLFVLFLMIICGLLLLIRKKTYKKQTSFY